MTQELSHREVVVHGIYPWYLAGSDFSNFLKRPDSSSVPLGTAQLPGATRALVYFATPTSIPRLPGVLRELGIPTVRAATSDLGHFQLWDY